jgi:hypothetical protein
MSAVNELVEEIERLTGVEMDLGKRRRLAEVLARTRGKFPLGTKVCIDGDSSIRAAITGVAFYTRGVMYECGWVHNGGHQSAWIDEDRLTEAEQ